MKFQPGDIVYDASANSVWCTLAKVKVLKIVGSSQNQYYEVEIINPIFCMWKDYDVNIGDIENATESTLFENYADAEEKLFLSYSKYYDIDIRTWKDFLAFLFEKWHM